MKHLIYLIDGTAKAPDRITSDDRFTNIYKLAQLIAYRDKAGNQQIVHYSRGIGGKDNFYEIVTAALGYGALDRAIELYINICANRQPDDKIYIFGYSRGAAVARLLSGLVSIGLLDDSQIFNVRKISKSYQEISNIIEVAWKNKLTRSAPKIRSKINLKLTEIRKKFDLIEADVDFLGLFDTVPGPRSVFGLTRPLGIKFESLVLDGHPARKIRNIIHILATHERRIAYSPRLYVEWPPLEDSSDSRFEQIWLPGTHGDIGGGSDNGISDLALALLIDRVLAQTELQVHQRKLVEKIRDDKTPLFASDSTRFYHRLMGRALLSLRKPNEIDRNFFPDIESEPRIHLAERNENLPLTNWSQLRPSEKFISAEMQAANDAFR